MKKQAALFFTIILFTFYFQNTQAQFWKKIKEKVVEKVEEKVIDKTVEKTEEEMDDILNNKKKKSSKQKAPKEQTTSKISKTEKKGNSKNSKTPIKNKPIKVWRNYKFIPGEKVIFYDDLKSEEVGEFPSRWDLREGGAEVASFNNEKVIIPTTEYNNNITPLFNNSNYLGDEFTIEFDFYLDTFDDTNDWQHIYINFISTKEDFRKKSSDQIHITPRYKKLEGYVIDGNNFNFEEISLGEYNSWHHIAISYYKGKLKIYYDDKRVLNLPNYTAKIDGVSINIEKPIDNNDAELKTAIKNIRIARGGGQMYKRIMADGKYVTNGILFDSGKATIKPQSMGVINKMAAVLNEKPGWDFKIIGHTDSDGDDATNLKLSAERAEAVKKAIVAQGIEAERLTTVGKGESEPLNTNSTKEEKANNRRVEFIRN